MGSCEGISCNQLCLAFGSQINHMCGREHDSEVAQQRYTGALEVLSIGVASCMA